MRSDALHETSPAVRILLLLPTKYLKAEIPNHTSARAKRNRVSDDDRALVQAWRDAGLLYECASDLYDDWYWMYASVAETRAEEPTSSVMPRDGATRVVTNDAMRDHWNELLPPDAFRRWKHAQIVSFGCHNSTYAAAMALQDEAAAAAAASDGATRAPPGLQGEAMAAPAAAPDAAGGSMPKALVAAPDGATSGPAVQAVTDEDLDETSTLLHRGMRRMREVGLDGPLRTWIAPVPQLSVEAQASGPRWHVPVPDTEPQQWLCLRLPC